ncbi:MAG: hypothetical protein EAZ55_00725 [Cytophagales bacterium]|nr:MAG: hypothetical protein EAZ55_00725 [Cytophagales bacterium]
MIKRLILLPVFLISSLISIGQNNDSVIVFKSEKDLLKISKQVYFFEDKEGKLTIEDIQKPEYQRKFKKSDKEILKFGTISGKVWVKITVSNHTKKDFFLEARTAVIWYLDFYKPDRTGKLVLTTQTGIMRPMKNREMDNNFFLFKLSDTSATQTYYLVASSDHPISLPLTLATAQVHFEHRYPYILFFGAFLGLVLIMFFYNLFVYFSVRDSAYLYYCGYLLTSLCLFMFTTGNYAYQYNIVSYFSEYLYVFIFLMTCTICLFLVKLLQQSRQTLFFKILSLYTIIVAVLTIVNLVTGHYRAYNEAFQVLTIVFNFYIFFYSLAEYRKGNTQARFVVFGFSFFLLGAGIHIAENLRIIDRTDFIFIANASIVGISLEVLMFSLALGDRINILRREKEVSQNALLAQTKENEKLVKEQNIILEQKVTEKTQQLSIANSTKDKLFSIIGHDLRGPVASLISLLDLIAEDYITEEEFKALTSKLQRSVKNMHNTLENLLQWSKSQMESIEAYPQTLAIEDLVKEDFRLYEITAQNKNIQFFTELHNTQPPYADENHIRLVLRNLIGNALKFTPTGGTVLVTCQDKMQDTKESMVEIVIRDTGVGMSAENAAKLFDRGQIFTTYGTAGEKGTGLGLLLCKEMVEKNGGQIGVSSELGKGSSFYFTLPITPLEKNND